MNYFIVKERQTIVVQYHVETNAEEYTHECEHTILEREELDCLDCEILDIEKL